MNSYPDFKDIMNRLLRGREDILLKIENVGFMPEHGSRDMNNVTWEKVQNYRFLSQEVPIEGDKNIEGKL